MGVAVTVSGDLAALLTLDRQLKFAVASALTAVAKAAQTESIRSIKQQFITRSAWYLPSNRFGIQITPATREKLEADVHTAAHWLDIHEQGGRKRPSRGLHIAVPTKFVRPDKRTIIGGAKRPRGLGKQLFPLRRRDGSVWLYRRTGTGKYGVQPYFMLLRSVKITKRSTVIEPTQRVFEQQFDKILAAQIDRAIATARN